MFLSFLFLRGKHCVWSEMLCQLVVHDVKVSRFLNIYCYGLCIVALNIRKQDEIHKDFSEVAWLPDYLKIIFPLLFYNKIRRKCVHEWWVHERRLQWSNKCNIPEVTCSISVSVQRTSIKKVGSLVYIRRRSFNATSRLQVCLTFRHRASSI